MKGSIISEQVMNLGEVKEILHNVKERDAELNFRAQKTLEYIDEVVRLDIKEAKKLADDLEKLEIPLLKDQHIQKLVGVLPTNVEDVKVVLQGFSITVTKENMQKIADAVKPYAKE